MDPEKRHIVVEEDVTIGPDISFDKDIEIDNVKCGNIIIDGATFHRTIYIHGGTFKTITIKDARFRDFIMHGGALSSLHLSGQNDMQECVIKKISCDNIIVDDGRYRKYFEIDQAKVKNYVAINGGNFEGSYGVSLSITDNEIERTFAVSGGIYATNATIDGNKIREIEIKGGEFKKRVTLQGKNSSPSCLIEGGVFHHEFLITDVNLSCLTVNNSFSKLKLKDTHIRECVFSEEIDYPLNIYKSFFDELSFDNIVTPTGKVAIDNCKIDLLLLEEFVNDGYVRINNLVPINASESQIIFIKSVLGKMVLSGLSFSSYNKIVIDNCKLDSIDTLIEPFPVSDKVYTDREGGRDLQKLSEIYKQLYFSVKSRGDRVNEIAYYAEYMEAYRQHLKRTKKDWVNRTALYVNKWSTNYGQNWWRGVLVILGISLVLYFFYCFFYCVLSPKVAFGVEHFTYSNLSFYAVKYVEFLNPVHRIDFMNGDLPDFGSALIDFLARIIIGTLIYQTIVAFRRLGRF